MTFAFLALALTIATLVVGALHTAPRRTISRVPFLGTFAVDALGTAVEIPVGYNSENIITFQAPTVTDIGASDTVTLTLPPRWQGVGFTVVGVRMEKWTTGSPATAAGARTKTNLAVSIASFVESTGVLTVAKGDTTTVTNATESARVIVQIAPST